MVYVEILSHVVDRAYSFRFSPYQTDILFPSKETKLSKAL